MYERAVPVLPEVHADPTWVARTHVELSDALADIRSVHEREALEAFEPLQPSLTAWRVEAANGDRKVLPRPLPGELREATISQIVDPYQALVASTERRAHIVGGSAGAKYVRDGDAAEAEQALFGGYVVSGQTSDGSHFDSEYYLVPPRLRFARGTAELQQRPDSSQPPLFRIRVTTPFVAAPDPQVCDGRAVGVSPGSARRPRGVGSFMQRTGYS